jgi:flagellar biosynthetic protein FlhB
MSEQPAGEKTLPATPRKIEQSRQRGQVSKSQDLNSSVLLLVSGLGLWVLGPMAMARLLEIMQLYVSESWAMMDTPEYMQNLVIQGFLLTAPVVLPLMLLLMVGGFVINVTQIGFLYSGQAIQPKLNRINPIKGLQRYFSLRSFVELVKSLAKLFLIGYIVYLSIRNRVDELVNLMNMTPLDASLVAWEMMFTIWWRVAVAMLVLGLLDFGYQRWQYLQELRMSQHEMKEEMKQLEGDPQIRQRVRQIQRQMTMQRMMGDVPEADVVITNPTTYAIAIRYSATDMSAPKIVAKGARIVAERIREIALENDVPILERPELARTLYRTVEIGDYVPEHLFRAVAEILAYIYEIDRRTEKIAERSNAGNLTPSPA